MRASVIAALLAVSMGTIASAGCDDEDVVDLDDFLPALPAPTGEPQAAWAGAVTADSPGELIAGPSAWGMVGDYYMRNDRVRVVIQAPGRMMGVVPFGGNVIDAVATDGDGRDATGDHFGEMSSIYLLGRTCDHTAIEVVRDGSQGGVAVIRARGQTAANDMLNIRGYGIINVPVDLDPDIGDSVQCATTYTLAPGANSLAIEWTFYNPDELDIVGPFGTFGDAGGEVGLWAPERGFAWPNVLSPLDLPGPSPYEVLQAPGLAYGLVPRHADAGTPNGTFVVTGRLGMLFGEGNFLRALDRDGPFFELPAGGGVTHAMDLVVARDAAGVDAVFRAITGQAAVTLAGAVAWDDGAPAAGARIGVYRDVAGNGAVDADDPIVTYIDADDDGRFSGSVSVVADALVVQAEVHELARSQPLAVRTDAGDAGDVELSLVAPVSFDYSIIDDATGALIPGKIAVLGRHPAAPDQRLWNTADRRHGVVTMAHAIRGTTVDVGDGVDPRLRLPAGGTYRVSVSHGTEWSVDDRIVTVAAGDPDGELTFRLRRVAPADGYLSSEYHVHQIGSFDTHIGNLNRVRTVVADGVELFAATDHDFVTDLQPVIEEMGVQRLARAMVGLEMTTEGYGHFNAFPMEYDPLSPHHGAVEWARGPAGALTPGELFASARERGAEIIQINHPRLPLDGFSDQYRYFDRAGLTYDHETRQITGELSEMPVPNSWLRLPEASLWDDSFNILEVWNGVFIDDTNGDGIREITGLDTILRDYFNFLSLGLIVTPTANSDTHTLVQEPAGMPRTYVRVSDDSAAALESGAAVLDALETLSGAAPRDLVLTNGPHIQVRAAGQPDSALGQVLDGSGGSVTLDITIVSPAWAVIDTLEVFANATPEIRPDVNALQPFLCFTSRDPGTLHADDVCAAGVHGAQPMTVTLETVAPGFERHVAAVQVTVNVADVDMVNRAGASGQDAWLVVRARGNRAIFPVMLDDVIAADNLDDNLDILVAGTPEEQAAVLDAKGVPAMAMTAPVYVDFDGGGYRAIFSP